ncbi:beta-ribofuranosylaminobenzene 5'-phosphate synthase family protein [Neorhizobium tomejilense]|uniref:beta-ribofuranosylaminobenzene 5'-phosphate synthase family protein n=1 Tax=Neorhizobium tomejilense TaxID=2093828 RepID=UPI000CF8AFCC|nr:beta-ribofuranosylaminobenzene 5'-phosphate synthase family protein [Neorhizobium tomejilense]
MIEITVPARIAVSLVGLSDGGYRINGGIGWAIDEPRLIIQAIPADKFQIIDARPSAISANEIENLLAILQRQKNSTSLDQEISLEVSGELLPHRGQGGGTALRLAALEAFHLINGSDYPRPELIRASLRGGTSGIGIRTYFDGGFVFDVGHKSSERPRPSHAWTAPRTPLSLAELKMPEWPIGICVPHWLPSISHEEEKAFFAGVLPVPHSDVMEVLYHMVFGAAAAVAEDDRHTFNQAIDAVQKSVWKAAERSRYGADLREIEEQLRRAGAAGVGMSSMGPTLYFDATQFDPARLSPNIVETVFITKPSNVGRTITFREA